MKTIKIIVEDIRCRSYEHDHFKVVRVINLLNPKIGECLSEDELSKFVRDPHVTVEIIPIRN